MEKSRNLTAAQRHGIAIAILLLIIITLTMSNIRFRRSIRDNEERAILSEIATCQIEKFDPNTVQLAELLSMGLTNSEALSLLRYRATGKIFRIKEELISCYGFSDSLYWALEPYIEIGEEFQYKKREYASREQEHRSKSPNIEYLTPTKFLMDTVGQKYLTAIGALTPRQAAAFIKWRDMSGIYSEEELRKCYVVSDSIATILTKWAIFTPPATQNREVAKSLIDLNRADSATLRSIYGIGEKSVVAIMDYRQKIGGFFSTAQLSEIDCITESNFEKIISQIFADSCDISKIDINFASAKELSSNPYIAPRLRKLLKIRQLKGGWSTLEELIDDKIFTSEEAQRVRPYLHFEVQGGF